ncbi:lysylphosphatidylglycerol synthase domain-containing protein [Burkholderiaceae bacterium UC74_6]
MLRKGTALLAPLVVAAVIGGVLAASPRLRESIPQAFHQAATIPAGYWLLGLAGFTLCYLARATRLWLEWRTVSDLKLRTMLAVAVQHNAAVHLLPMRAGEVAFPLLMKRHAGAGLTDSALSLATLRLQDFATVMALAVLLLWPGAGSLGLLLAAVAAFLLLQPRLQAWRPQHPKLARLAEALRRSRAGHIGWLLCFISWSLKIGVVALLLTQLTQLPALTALRGALGGELSAGMPVQGPAQFGAYEASMLGTVMLDVGRDLDAAAMTAAAFVVHLFIFLVACFAGLIGWIHDFVMSGREYVGP